MSAPSPILGATAADYFGAMAGSYDSLITRAVPRYAEMTERLLDYLPASPRSILELGCGTGNLTLALAARFPQATLTTVDAAPEMTALTAHRLNEAAPRAAPRARFITARFEDLDLPPASFDLVTSCISLHHVRDKGSLYRAIARWLAPRGIFRFADQLAGATTTIHDLNWRRWIEFCRRPGGCSEAEIQSLLDHAAAHDHYTPLPEHFDLLRAAGFEPRSLDCLWRNWIWGIISAEKS